MTGVALQGEENHEWKAEVTSSLAGSMDASRSSSDDVSGQWEGGDVEFMTENRHSRERTGVWNTEGLEGAALAVVKGDKEAGRCQNSP